MWCSVHTVYVCTGRKQQPTTLKLGGVSVNFISILKREEELAPLALCIPKDAAARKRSNTLSLYLTSSLCCVIRYRMVIKPKAVRWGVPWSAVEDSKLLVGLYEHGMGNWSEIKEDKSLGLQDKVRWM